MAIKYSSLLLKNLKAFLWRSILLLSLIWSCIWLYTYPVIYTYIHILVLLLQNRGNSKINAPEWVSVECIKLFSVLELILHSLVNAEHWKPLCIYHPSRKKIKRRRRKKHTKPTINCLLCLVWYYKAVINPDYCAEWVISFGH